MEKRYQIVGELDRGGMANVYLCLTGGTDFSKLQVLKCLKKEMREDAQLVTMFLDEGRIATRLNHPNVVQTYDVGIEDERYFIAMEYLEGQSLAKVLRAYERKHGQPLPRAVHLRVLCDAMRGLEYAHSLTDFSGTPLRIIHRDVSPQNIFITYSGAVKVIDFGIAKAAMRASASTEVGIMKGKASYVAPEQAMGLVVDHRVDVFAMGMLLWAAAVGRPMWGSATPDVQRLASILAGTLEMPRDVNPSVPAPLDEIVRKALRKNASDRHSSMNELRLEVERYLVAHEPPPPLHNDERHEILIDLFASRKEAVEQAIRSHLAKARTEQLIAEDINEDSTPRKRPPMSSVSPTVTSSIPSIQPTAPRRDKMMIALNVVMALVVMTIGALALLIYLRAPTTTTATAAIAAQPPVLTPTDPPAPPLASSATTSLQQPQQPPARPAEPGPSVTAPAIVASPAVSPAAPSAAPSSMVDGNPASSALAAPSPPKPAIVVVRNATSSRRLSDAHVSPVVSAEAGEHEIRHTR